MKILYFNVRSWFLILHDFETSGLSLCYKERSGLHYCVESSDVKRGQNLEVEDVAEAEAETEAKASRPKTRPEL